MSWEDLSIKEKSDLMRLYISNGIMDLDTIKEHYNAFQDGGKLTFKQWKSQMQSKYPDIEMDNTKAGYDYNRYFNDNYDDAIRQLSKLGHFPDTYKLPNHKTFSNESIYSRGPMMGGNWVNDSTFSPSIINRQQYPNIYEEDRPYTEREIYGDKYQQGGHLYQKGGPTNNKSDWAKAHETELVLQQLGWNNSNNRLHSDYAAKDSNGYYAGYNLKPVAITAKHPLWDLPDYQGKEDNPNINAHKDELWENRKEREEAGKEYLSNIGKVGLAVGTLPMLSYGAVAAPLATGISLAGGEGLNFGINELTPYTSWGNMLAEGVFNTNNKLAQTTLEFTNPGFLLGYKAVPFINNQYRGSRMNTRIKPSSNPTSYNFSIDDKRFINDVAGYSGYDVKNAMLKLRERFGDLIIPERWLNAPEKAARMLIDNRLADFNMGLKTKFIPKGMSYDKINNQFQNLYFKNGEILPEFNNDITVTNIPKTTEAVIDNQTLPRLMLDEDRKYLLGKSDSFVEDFTFGFDKALQSKYYWSSNELWNAFSMNQGKGGYYVPKKQRVVIPKEHSYTTPTHETIHSIEEQLPRTFSENKLLESYGSIPMDERGPTNAEVRQRVLDKMNVNIKSSLKEQNNAIDKISDEDLIEILKITNGYAQKAVQNESINKKSLSGIREAMKKVGIITGVISTGALNKNQ